MSRIAVGFVDRFRPLLALTLTLSLGERELWDRLLMWVIWHEAMEGFRAKEAARASSSSVLMTSALARVAVA